MTKRKFVLLPHIQPITENAVSALSSGASVAVSGGEGVGTTSLCRHICERWKEINGGNTMSFTAFAETDQLRLLQHVAGRILGSEMPSDWRLHCASDLLHAMGEKVRSSKVGLIFIDRADLAPEGFIDAMMTMSANCGDLGSNVGILLGIRQEGVQFSIFESCSSTCIAYTANVKPLEGGQVLAVLSQISGRFAEVIERIKSQDVVAIEALHKLTHLSRGVFRRLVQFAHYIEVNGEEVKGTSVGIEALWNRAFTYSTKA